MSENKTIVLSLGGSILVPGPQASRGHRGKTPDFQFINTTFLDSFLLLMSELTQQGRRLVITVGGGRVNSVYVEALRRLGVSDNRILDNIGITVTRVNANFLLQALFSYHIKVYPKVVASPHTTIRGDWPIIIGCGWKPGCSTDYDAVLWAINRGAESLVNASNISHVFTADPRKDKNAKPISLMSWADLRKLVGDRWEARKNTPFDPIAAQLAQEHNIQVRVLDGNQITNLRDALEGKQFIGTTIKD